MASPNQVTGTRGERLVTQLISCPGCKGGKTLKTLRANQKCADLVCDFCGYLAQVKTQTWKKADFPEQVRSKITGAAWGPQKERMDAGIFFSLFVVLAGPDKEYAIYFLPRDLQTREMFVMRNPLGPTAKRKEWQGYNIDLSKGLSLPIKLVSSLEN